MTGSTASQNPVPLLPTDGGDFVAIQKKSLVDEFNDPHHVMTSILFFLCALIHSIKCLYGLIIT